MKIFFEQLEWNEISNFSIIFSNRISINVCMCEYNVCVCKILLETFISKYHVSLSVPTTLFIRWSGWKLVLVIPRNSCECERSVEWSGPSFRKYRTGSMSHSRSFPSPRSPCSPSPVSPGELYFGDGILPPVLSNALPNFGNDWWLLRTGPNPLRSQRASNFYEALLSAT